MTPFQIYTAQLMPSRFSGEWMALISSCNHGRIIGQDIKDCPVIALPSVPTPEQIEKIRAIFEEGRA